MQWKAALMAAAAIGATIPATAATPVDVEDVDRTYVLRGWDGVALVREMTRSGPQHPTGRRSWAYTAWEVATRYDLVAGDGGCALQSPRVRIRVETTLPVWTPDGRPDWRLRSAWSRMYDQLVRHEAEHRRHGLAAAQATADGLERLGTMPDCRTVEREARRVLRHAVTAAGRESRAFDRTTDYGAGNRVRLDR